MHFNIYLIVKDFESSIGFYEKLLQMKVSAKNMNRFAQFCFDDNNISINNGFFDIENPQKIITRGKFNELDNTAQIANMKNTHKIVLNFAVEDLLEEHNRIKKFVDNVSEIKCINAGKGDYWYFNFLDPDGNIIEITGGYNYNEIN